MMLLVAILLLCDGIGSITAIIVIYKSADRGVQELHDLAAPNTNNQTARRILAWNLIEPGITLCNAIIVILINEEVPLGKNASWLQILAIIWPMILFFFIIPGIQIVFQGNQKPYMLWAMIRSSGFGIMRIIVTILIFKTFGFAIVIMVPLLIISISKMSQWSEDLDFRLTRNPVISK